MKRGREEFTPSATFAGARPGYVFRSGSSGTGYYPDGPSDAQQPAPTVALDGAALLAEAEAAAGEEEGELDVLAVRRAVTQLSRRLKENVEARARFAAEPSRFAESEVELHAELQRLRALAAAPELYPELVRLGAAPLLLQLLAHENAYVAAECAEALRELTEGDPEAETAEAAAGGQALAGALLDEGLLPLLLSTLQRLDEAQAEEQAAAHSLLAVLENVCEASPELRARLLEHAPLLTALLSRVKGRKGGAKEVGENRAYAAELLAVLLAGTGSAADAAREQLGDSGGVDVLLRAIAPFKAKKCEAGGGEDAEADFLDSCFDCLCAALMLPANQAAFLEGEGVELMLLIVRAKGAGKTGALKALDFALTRCPAAAERLVDAGGLGAVFAAFSGRSLGACRRLRGAEAAREEELRSVSLVAQLFAQLPLGDERRSRLAAKFVEAGHEKVDRLAELWVAWARRLRAAEADLPPAEEGDDEGDAEAERYAARLEGGLFTLQHLAAALAELWAHGHPGVNQRALSALRVGGCELADVRTVLREAAAGLGDAGVEGEAAAELEKERARLNTLADGISLLGEEDEDGEEAADPADDPKREGLMEEEEDV